MPLRDPRTGTSVGFHVYPATSDQGTLADPETIVWSSIRHLCSRDVAEGIAAVIHGVKRKRDLQAVARNLKVYIQQASEFYHIASGAKPNTAPLIYYYSFLNLAKALCEIRWPRLHKRPECYRHGISWRPKPNYLVDPEREEVSVTSRGVWHLLWESLAQTACPAPNPTKFKIKQLFLYCPEISIEVEKAFCLDIRLVNLVDPDILYDSIAKESWIRFSVERDELRYYRLSANAMMNSIKNERSGYTEVKSAKNDLRTFETTSFAHVTSEQEIWESLRSDILGMNVFCYLDRGNKITYSLPLQARLPLPMPQLMTLYTILFWLGSLVRYDPHSVDDLMESQYWSLVDGFMSQSRLWLLEQFEWSFYQAETSLWLVR